MKNEDYLVHNLQLIGNHLEHINWNLGKIVAHLLKDKELNKKLDADKPKA